MTSEEFKQQQAALERELKVANLQRQIKESQEWTWEREAAIQSGIDPVLSSSYHESTETLMNVLQGQTSQQPGVYVQPTASSPNYLLWVVVVAAAYFLFVKRR